MTPTMTAGDRAALRCSEQRRAAGGSAVGSTPPAAGLLLVEVPLPWAADVTAAEPLAAVAQAAPGHRVQAVLPQGDLPPGEVRVVRYHRPAGPFDRYRRQERVLPTRTLVAGVAALLRAPTPAGGASGGTSGGPADGGPIDDGLVDVLVCTHGTRDACCGRAGVPLYRELREAALPGLRVWRTSHLGGHRFAPTALTLPDGRAWAWLGGPTLAGIVRRDVPVEVAAAHDRGCAGFDDPWAQAADHAALAREGWGWLDRPREVAAVPAAPGDPAGGSADTRRRLRVTAPGVAYEVEVEVARTLPVPVCGEPLDAATKSEAELRVLSVEEAPPCP